MRLLLSFLSNVLCRWFVAREQSVGNAFILCRDPAALHVTTEVNQPREQDGLDEGAFSRRCVGVLTE
jgi:hypothetical protein